MTVGKVDLVVVSVRVPSELLRRIKASALRDERLSPEWIREALRRAVVASERREAARRRNGRIG